MISPNQRSQSFSFNDSTGQITATVAGETYTTQVDDAGRALSVTGPDSTATYTYFNNDQVKSVTYSNGTSVAYEYLDNGWLYRITHLVSGTPNKLMTYFYDATGRIVATQERGFDDSIVNPPFGQNAVIQSTFNKTVINLGPSGPVVNQHLYLYDARGRLTREVRFGPGVFADYDISYTYDNGGNR
ncbi:MAG: hypothetical protein GXP29_11210, partial [Planctomycetes bacterium]|nr:hypothetical protein [Planctomycetota bacterium]